MAKSKKSKAKSNKSVSLQWPPPLVEEDELSSEKSESGAEGKRETPTGLQNQTKASIAPAPSQSKKTKSLGRENTPPPTAHRQLGNDEEWKSDEERSNFSPSASDFTIKVHTPKHAAYKDSKSALKRTTEPKDVRSSKRAKAAKAGKGSTKKEKSMGRVCGEEDERSVQCSLTLANVDKETFDP